MGPRPNEMSLHIHINLIFIDGKYFHVRFRDERENFSPEFFFFSHLNSFVVPFGRARSSCVPRRFSYSIFFSFSPVYLCASPLTLWRTHTPANRDDDDEVKLCVWTGHTMVRLIYEIHYIRLYKQSFLEGGGGGRGYKLSRQLSYTYINIPCINT